MYKYVNIHKKKTSILWISPPQSRDGTFSYVAPKHSVLVPRTNSCTLANSTNFGFIF